MQIIEESVLAGMKTGMFKEAAKCIDYQINDFNKCYHKYMGCGHHMYILVKEYDDRVSSIGSQRINGRLIAMQLKNVINEFRIVVIDVEMGGMSVWKNE